MLIFLLSAGGVFAACQWLARRAPEGALVLLGGNLQLKPAVNKAGAAGLLKDRPGLLPWLSGLALLFTAGLAFSQKAGRFALGLCFGGGASNLYERLRNGGVLDYIRFPRLPGKLGKLIFNPADFCIFAGLLAYIAKELRS